MATDVIKPEALIAATPKLQQLLDNPLRASNPYPFLLPRPGMGHVRHAYHDGRFTPSRANEFHHGVVEIAVSGASMITWLTG